LASVSVPVARAPIFSLRASRALSSVATMFIG
jgi:hypothetical protein